MNWTGYTCDRCGKEYREKGGMRLGFRFGLEEDPAEGLKRGYHALDICLSCAAKILADTIADMGGEGPGIHVSSQQEKGSPVMKTDLQSIQEEHRAWLERNFGVVEAPVDVLHRHGHALPGIVCDAWKVDLITASNVKSALASMAQEIATLRAEKQQREQFLGLVEELGELAHALLKKAQRIRGTPDEHEAAAKDAIGDLLIFASGFCCRMGWDLQEILEATWAEVRERDWRTNPVCGTAKP